MALSVGGGWWVVEGEDKTAAVFSLHHPPSTTHRGQGLLGITSPPSGVQRARHETASMPSAMGRTDPSRNTKVVTPSWKLLKPQAQVQRCSVLGLGAQLP